MPTVSRGLPADPHLSIPKKQARELLQHCKEKFHEAIERIKRQHPRFKTASADQISERLKLSDAQLVIAREYGFASWTQLKERIDGNTAARQLDRAIRSQDGDAVRILLTAHPNLLHVPLVSGNWGPPMSHAANMDLLGYG